MRAVKIWIIGITLLVGTPLAAQDSFDRTNPASQVSRDDLTQAPQIPIRIEVQPVLETLLPSESTGVFDVGAIVIDGLVTLDRSVFASAIESFAGRPLDRDELVQLTDRIAQAAR